MTTEYVWSVLRDDLIARWADKPTALLEQRLLDVFERHPQLVLDASEQIAERYDRGIVRSPWAVFVKHVEGAAAAAERADRPAAGERDKTKARAQAAQWIKAAGVHFDVEAEVDDELFGSFGMLRDYADDDELRETLLALWRHERPRGEREEERIEEESRRDIAYNAKQRELRARRLVEPEPELVGAEGGNPFL